MTSVTGGRQSFATVNGDTENKTKLALRCKTCRASPNKMYRGSGVVYQYDILQTSS